MERHGVGPGSPDAGKRQEKQERPTGFAAAQKFAATMRRVSGGALANHREWT
jgi:hypothetical protein